jgi:hypothetical protein
MKSYHVYDPDINPLPYGWDHPEGVPRNYDELHDQHRKFVLKILGRHNKVERNAMDLYQGVWQRFLESDILNKFERAAARRLPLTMRGEQVVQFLGITWNRWIKFLRTHDMGRCLEPKYGHREAMHAVWDTDTICDVDYQREVLIKDGVFAGRSRIKRKRPTMTSRGFKTYIQKAIHHAFANLCRTKDRRHKEQVLPPTTVLNYQSDGSYRQSADIEDFSSWEVNITAAMTDEEAMIDLRDLIRKANLDLGSDKGLEVVDFMVQQGSATEDGPRRNKDLLTFLGQGCTLTEAAQKVRHKARARAVTQT